MRKEADAWIGVENLLPGRGKRAHDDPCGWKDRDPRKTAAFGLEQHAGAENQRDASKHLVGDPKQRPQGIDSSQGIDYALVEEISPATDTYSRCDQAGT